MDFGLILLATLGQSDMAQLKQEAERGDTMSMCMLADRYRNGILTKQDFAEARRWYEKLAKQDHSCGKLGLGMMYLNGEGVRKNETEAMTLLTEAADLGMGSAMLIVGQAFEEGRYGVKQDYKEAARYYEDAASILVVGGMVRLGVLYEKGLGVPQDFARAAKLYREGADLGEAEPMFMLGLLYYKGTGVPRDLAEAHKWVNIAATRAMGEDQKQLISVRDDITKQLTAEQLVEAQKRAREWLAAFEKSRGGAVGGVFGGLAGGVAGGMPAPPPPPSAVRVGGTIKEPRKIKDAPFVYPPIAQSARVQGLVILEATIGPDGKVVDVTVIRSIPLLDQAAIDAVRQWEYTPTLMNDVPVSVIMTVTANFTLK